MSDRLDQERVWEFDVAVSSHDLLKQGVTIAGWIRTTVLAEGYDEAELVAAQMGGCHGIPTVTRIRI